MGLSRAASVLSAAAFALGVSPAVHAASQTRPMAFAKGTSAATLQGSVKGHDTMDHTLRAAAGQTLTVSMKASHASAFFNVLPPGSRDVAIYNSSIHGNDHVLTLEQSGVYTIRVYLMRNEARRGVQADYTLRVGITGAAAPGDAKVAGTAFHATGQLPCSMGTEVQGMCPFGVIRGGPGQAEVRITPPGGMERTLIFSGHQVTAPGSRSVSSTRQGDEWTVEVNDFERYRVPDAVVNGG